MLYVNNIILFILIVHNTDYFFTSSKSMRTVKQNTVVHVYQSVNKEKYNVEEIIRSKWNNTVELKRTISTWCRRRDRHLCFLSDAGNDVTSFAKGEEKKKGFPVFDVRLKEEEARREREMQSDDIF